MNASFQEFLAELSKKTPNIDYDWTPAKESSCRWIIDRIKQGEVGLDVGGTEWLCHELTKRGVDITCFDMTPSRTYPKWVQGDMMEVGDRFEQRSFDFITTRHTLEHSIAPLFQLWCYNRLLKDKGRLFVIVPVHIREWIWYPTHHNCLPHENWIMLFHRAGFRMKWTDAGTWNPADFKFVEHRYELEVEHREMRLDSGPPWLNLR